MDLALLVEGRAPTGLALTRPGEAIGKRFTVVGEHRLDRERRLLLHPLHERSRIFRAVAASDF